MNYSRSLKRFINLLIFSIYIFFLVTISTRTLFTKNHRLSDKENLEYEMVVEAQIIPFYAIDVDDNPVYDLKKEDISLYVNKKSTEIIDFKRFYFQFQNETDNKKIFSENANLDIKRNPVRYVFVVIDCIFNSMAGLNRSFKICRDIIKNSSDNDFFIFLDNSLNSSLKYYCGPENNHQILFNNLKKMSKISGEKLKKSITLLNPLFSRRMSRGIKGFSTADHSKAVEEAKMMENFMEMRFYRKRKQYQLKQFYKALTQLKYAFKTIRQPKIIYMISEGIPKNVFGGNDFESLRKLFFYEYLEETAKAINKGGSLLYVINPAKEQLMEYDPLSGKESLKLIAKKGGGRYLGGSSVDKISQKLTKSSAAYYEIAFLSNKISQKSLKIKIKPRDKHIKIFSIKQTGIRKPYNKMVEIEKNLFALNVILEASWSRMVGQVGKVNYINKKEQTKGKTNFVKVEILLPEDLKQKQLDIFAINLDPKSLKAKFVLQNIRGKEKLEISVKKMSRKDQYFVIVDPDTANCLYNKIN